MAIKKIKVKNFKSFKDTEIKLGNFNVLIGANASGKSNFIQIFRFLGDIAHYGLNNAISMQGGIEYIRNIKIGPSDNLLVEISFGFESKPIIRKRKNIIIKTNELTYRLALEFTKNRRQFEIAEDTLSEEVNFFKLEDKGNNKTQEVPFGKGKIIYSLTNGKIKIDLKDVPVQLAIKEDNLVPSFIRELPIPKKSSLISLLPIIHLSMFRLFIDNAIYDFDPKLPKKSTPITGKAELEEDGSNLAIVLNNILENEGKKRTLLNLMKDLLPFVDDVNVEKFADKSILLKLKEEYYHKEYLPASLISDGTINITALIIALYFEQKPLTIIEEPERNIHPYLISKIVELMKDVASKKQVLVTTHNPQMVKFAGQENILLISRDKDGFSVISKPYEKETVREFLKNELGIEDLFIQNLL